MRTLHLATAALLSLGAAVPAAGAAEPVPRDGLYLTVSGAGDTWTRGVRLECTPGPGGHHPYATESCTALHAAGGDPDALEGQPYRCTDEQDPVTATAHGTFEGRTVNWRRTFPNACTLESATGDVFRF
ncbi:protease inhibitor SIL-V5 [Streptomyces sp. SID5785]|uniref:SSI family serine proteinase inhibitor n=1 Tax=Streptomyces sp. SID5785 TaxID=2690309 RepID=UPI001360C06D|nr:SSI family serine proteinase inhibitor [Streptomyces sp. SID5785]MZD10677.1 protease inhibitor SIL-V5 [Streptomyces sp. SID5785]